MTALFFLLILLLAAMPIIIVFSYLKYSSPNRDDNRSWAAKLVVRVFSQLNHVVTVFTERSSCIAVKSLEFSGFYESHIYRFLLKPVVYKAIVLVCLATQLYSFLLPGVMTFRTGGHGDQEMSSLAILLTGWMAPLFMNPQFAWYATPLFFMAAYASFMGRNELAHKWSSYSLLAATNTFLWFIWPTPGDEGVVTHIYLKYPLSGFFVWYTSITVIYVLNSHWLRPQVFQNVSKLSGRSDVCA